MRLTTWFSPARIATAIRETLFGPQIEPAKPPERSHPLEWKLEQHQGIMGYATTGIRMEWLNWDRRRISGRWEPKNAGVRPLKGDVILARIYGNRQVKFVVEQVDYHEGPHRNDLFYMTVHELEDLDAMERVKGPEVI